jgi:hypothetical protein
MPWRPLRLADRHNMVTAGPPPWRGLLCVRTCQNPACPASRWALVGGCDCGTATRLLLDGPVPDRYGTAFTWGCGTGRWLTFTSPASPASSSSANRSICHASAGSVSSRRHAARTPASPPHPPARHLDLAPAVLIVAFISFLAHVLVSDNCGYFRVQGCHNLQDSGRRSQV